MRKFRINWTWIFWISLTILFIWLLAKALGFIHTPLIIEAIPYVTGFATILAAGKKIGEYAQQLTRAIADIAEIKGDVQGLRKDVHRLDKRLSIVETRLCVLETRISA
ncbi:MAG TPA: hypothetical protein VJH37_02545 [Candidatus Nanoarchaeia archaeon]|nr:hypothetical protein [Candidatus Nanoarchaeia archaeon]